VADVKYLLIGGGLASFHCAKNLRRTDAEGSILMVSEEDIVPYDRPPLSKESIRGEKTREDIIYESPEKLAEQNIGMKLGSKVTALNVKDKNVTLANGETISYEKAFIATGGRVIRIPIPGANLPGVYYLRDLPDAEALNAEAKTAKKAVVIGAGFIGLETAASLTQLGVQVTVIEAMPHIWARFADEELAGFFQDYCTNKGITFVLDEMVTEIKGDTKANQVITKSGRTFDADFVCVGIGIVPNVELARDAGLAVENGIVVNEFNQTSDPDVYAAGDVVNYHDPVFNRRRRVEHWGHAEYGGQIAGRNMAAGNETAYDFLSYVWSDIFDLRLESAGDESERDTVILRGKYEDAKFTVLYLKDGQLTAYLAVNGDIREFTVWRRLIRGKNDLRGKEEQLKDQTFNVRDLLKATT
jgi:3-phenylpropionate/trans-cinnamate dioxygenase ferredoxin reductase component